MSEVKWVDKHLEVSPPRKPKKLTGTRFATVLGLNPWSSEFEIWCAVTRTYEKPFEDTIYTAAGKVIEPKQAEYMKKSYMMDNLRTPTDLFGKDYFRTTHGDFFPREPILGGLWDYLLVNEKGHPQTVIECKTTKRSEDWKDDVPEYYALQASLYAWLLGVDDVIMVCSFLDAKDYEHPEKFEPSVENTITRTFKVSERYPNFKTLVNLVTDWWNTYVKTGISPNYDEKKDAEILKALRTTTVEADADIGKLVEEAEALKAEVDAHAAEMAEKEKRLKVLTDKIKDLAKGQFRENDKDVVVPGTRYIWKVTRTDSVKPDEKRMKEDGIWEAYTTTTTSYRMTISENKKEDK